MMKITCDKVSASQKLSETHLLVLSMARKRKQVSEIVRAVAPLVVNTFFAIASRI
jgi:hypothetical protein